MNLESEIEIRVREAFPDSDVAVTLDGNRALIKVASDRFASLSRVRRHQAVYACIEDFIADGSLHAVTIEAKTATERS